MFEVIGTMGHKIVRFVRLAGHPTNKTAQKLRDHGWAVTLRPVGKGRR